MERCSDGVLDRGSVGLWERWDVGAMEYRPDEVNGRKGLGRSPGFSLGDCILPREV
jgi:hypothetical protein